MNSSSLDNPTPSRFTPEQIAVAKRLAKKPERYMKAWQKAKANDKAIRFPERERLEKNGATWLAELIPAHFRGGATAFAAHHLEAIDWAWKLEPNVAPDPPALMVPWSRGHMKSTLAEALAVACGARKTRRLVLYICRTQGQADSHVRSIESMLVRSNVGKQYPELARPQIREIGGKKRQGEWTHAVLTTDSDFAVAGYGLLGAERGIKVEEFRPDLIVIDDIDKVDDSPGMVDKLLNALAATVIGTQSMDCAIIVAQNPIHADSVIQRILDRQTDTLSDRIVLGPIPAVRGATYERRQEHWYITGGEATWPQGMPLPVAEQTVNKLGKEIWDRECQHEINLTYADAIYSMWSPAHHLVTWSEFVRFFEHDAVHRETRQPKLPGWGQLGFCIDWGNNPKHPAALRWVWWPERQPLADSVFFYREQCWPRYPKQEADERVGPSPIRVGRSILAAEKEWREDDRMMFRLNSHERPEIAQGLRIDMTAAGEESINCQQINTAEAREGIGHMQSLLTLIMDEPHPFRRYPDGHPKAGERMMGRPRAYFIVADGQGELYWDAVQRQLKVKPAIDERGMARTRFEYPRYRKPDTAQGTETKDPPKRDDDIIDCDRAIVARFYPSIQPLTAEERLQLALRSKGYDPKKAADSDLNDPWWWASRTLYEAELRNEQEPLEKWGLGREMLEEGAYEFGTQLETEYNDDLWIPIG